MHQPHEPMMSDEEKTKRTEEDVSAESTGYGYFRRVQLSFTAAVTAVKEALKAQGFGVLAEIDVQKTLREKLGVEFGPYLILGACNPKLAYEAISSEPELGLLLPCNVLVRGGEGTVEIGVIDAEKMMGFVGNPTLDDVAKQANQKLRAALASVV